jgi:hypothetical protein
MYPLSTVYAKKLLKCNWTHKLLVYAGDVNLLCETINIVKEHIEALLDASKEIGRQVKTEKTKNIYMSRHKTSRHNHYTRVIQKVRFPILYLNKITTYRVTHEAEIQSHISFTSPHSDQVCLDTYHSDISICRVLHRKKYVLGR